MTLARAGELTILLLLVAKLLEITMFGLARVHVPGFLSLIHPAARRDQRRSSPLGFLGLFMTVRREIQ
jgi:hypothetical protein